MTSSAGCRETPGETPGVFTDNKQLIAGLYVGGAPSSTMSATVSMQSGVSVRPASSSTFQPSGCSPDSSSQFSILLDRLENSRMGSQSMGGWLTSPFSTLVCGSAQEHCTAASAVNEPTPTVSLESSSFVCPPVLLDAVHLSAAVESSTVTSHLSTSSNDTNCHFLSDTTLTLTTPFPLSAASQSSAAQIPSPSTSGKT